MYQLRSLLAAREKLKSSDINKMNFFFSCKKSGGGCLLALVQELAKTRISRSFSLMVTERLPHLQPSQSHSSRKREKRSVKATFVPFMKQTKAFEKPLQDIFYVSNARIASPAFANCKNAQESVYLTWLWKAVTTGRNESMEDEHQIDSSAVTGTNDFTQVQTLGAPSNTQTESNL